MQSGGPMRSQAREAGADLNAGSPEKTDTPITQHDPGRHGPTTHFYYINYYNYYYKLLIH